MAGEQTAHTKKDTRSLWIILGSSFLVPIVIGIILIFSLGNRASADDLLNPASEQGQALLSAFDALSNPDAILANPSALEGLRSQLISFKQAYDQNQGAPNEDAVNKAVDASLTDIDCIVQNATSDKVKARGCAQDLLAERSILTGLLAPSGSGDIIQAARNTIEYNNPGGHISGNVGKILYKMDHSNYVFKNGYPDHLDCSAFISFVMAKAGVWKPFPNDQLSTADFWTQSGNAGNRFFLSRSYYTGKIITKDEIMGKIQDGTIKPGDLFLSGDVSGAPIHGDGHAHIVMYIGGDPAGDSIAASSGSCCGGPQYKKLNNVEDNVIAVIRVTPPAKAGGPSFGPFKTASSASKNGMTVCIDPGHPAGIRQADGSHTGQRDGAVDPHDSSITEMHLAWMVGTKLQKALATKGYGTVMTKDAETTLVNNDVRAGICNSSGADIMVRLHYDGDTSGGFANSFGAYVPTAAVPLVKGQPGPSQSVITGSEHLASLMLPAMAQSFGTPISGYSVSTSYRGDAQTAVGNGQGGILEASYFAKIPTILFEIANLSNDAEAEWSNTDAHQNQVVSALVAGIDAYKNGR